MKSNFTVVIHPQLQLIAHELSRLMWSTFIAKFGFTEELPAIQDYAAVPENIKYFAVYNHNQLTDFIFNGYAQCNVIILYSRKLNDLEPVDHYSWSSNLYEGLLTHLIMFGMNNAITLINVDLL